jgi:hypothetical protein
LKFPLVPDEDENVSRKHKALNFVGFRERKLVLNDTNKKVIWTGSMPSVNYLKPAEILSSIKQLKL